MKNNSKNIFQYHIEV